MKHFINLSVKLLVLSLILVGLTYLIGEVLGLPWIHQSIWNIISFFFILTWLTGIFTHYLLSISKENSVNILMGATAIRLLASIGFVAVMLFIGQENLILFVSNFFVVYLFYLLFDIYMLITNLRPNSK